jgi:hypothetical protein
MVQRRCAASSPGSAYATAAGPRGTAATASKSSRPRHPALVGIEEKFDGARLTDEGYLRPRKWLLADLFITNATLERALAVASEVLYYFEDYGHRVAVSAKETAYERPPLDHREKKGNELYRHDTWSPARPTVVHVGTVAFGLTPYEIAERVETIYVGSRRVRVDDPSLSRRQLATAWGRSARDLPSGRLGLRAYSPYGPAPWEMHWREEAVGVLSRKLPAIRRELLNAAAPVAAAVEEGDRQAAIEHERREARWREWEHREAERKREEAVRRQQEARKTSRQHLLAIVNAWSEARRMKVFFAELVREVDALETDERQDILARMKAAQEILGGVDPLAHFRTWKTPEETES